MSEDDQAQLSERLDVDRSQFNTRITLAIKSTQLARESIDNLKKQGIGLVNLGHDRFVPAANIMVAKPFSKEQAGVLADKGYKLGHTLRATVETTVGIVLSTGHPQQVMDRKVKGIFDTVAMQQQEVAFPDHLAVQHPAAAVAVSGQQAPAVQ